MRFSRILEVHAPAERAYEAWRRVEDFARFLPSVRSVRPNGDGTTEWDVQGPLPWQRLRWRAEVTADAPGSRLCWRSTRGNVRLRGQVEFIPANGGCVIMAVVDYAPPLGGIGRLGARIAGADVFIDSQLGQLLRYIETGEVPGQPVRRRRVGRSPRELAPAPRP
jgi:uncharacterized membrane protein